MYLKAVVLAFLSFVVVVNSARILAIVSIASFSHQNAYRALWRELSLRGHKVTLMTTDPMRDPNLTNLTEIDTSFAYDIMKEHRYNERILEVGDNFIELVKIFHEFTKDVDEKTFDLPEVTNLLKNDTVEFDLLMAEYLLSEFFPFAIKFKIPFIGLLSLDATYPVHDCFGNPSHPIANPDVMMPFVTDLSLYQRVVSSIYWVVGRMLKDYVSTLADKAIEKYFGPGYPPASELYCSADMMFLNVNPILDNPRAFAPGVINIGGGMHIKDPKPLPADLKTYLDSSKNGAIYFSLGGTNIQSKNLPAELLDKFKEALADVPYDVLWKYEDAEMANKPSNVKLVKWAPQQDVLRHPNVKLFITQGGVQSLEESIHSYVPILGVPFFADQKNNIAKIVSKGLGLEIDKDHFNKEDMKAAIIEVISNHQYKDNVKMISDLTKDQPMTGLEKAVWWTEYVLRHKGAPFMKGQVTKIPIYQYYLLDVIAVILLSLFITVYAMGQVFKISYKIIRKLFGKIKYKTA